MSTDPNADDYDPDEALKAAQDSAAAAQRLLEKERKAFAEKEAKLAEYEKEKAVATRTAAFKEAGLQPEWAEFYPADAEATPEKLKEWAEARKLTSVVAAPAPVESRSFVTPPQAAVSGQSLIPMSYFYDLARRDPTRAQQEFMAAVDAKRVEFTQEALDMLAR